MKNLRALLTGSATGERARVAEMDRLRIVLDFSVAITIRTYRVYWTPLQICQVYK